jgi:hypothetical protein
MTEPAGATFAYVVTYLSVPPGHTVVVATPEGQLLIVVVELVTIEITPPG